jgi:hypothetical protein
MGIVVFIHVLLFLTSASCSSYICRALNSSYSVRVSPTQVLYKKAIFFFEVNFNFNYCIMTYDYISYLGTTASDLS